jgi:hypothetical protein
MIESAMGSIPVLTEVVSAPPPSTELLAQDWLVQALPGLVRQAVAELQPQMEQQLLDALMPKLLASLAQYQPLATPEAASGLPRLP